METFEEEKQDNKIVTYEFSKKRKSFWEKLRKIVICICACLTSIPFGLMLAWPTPIYPYLLNLNKNSSLRITEDQSAMIAGFLMLGNSFGNLFTSINKIDDKIGIIIGNLIMTSGWFVLWQDMHLKYLLSGRFLTGFGHGFALGYLKSYISNDYLIKQINLYTFFAIILMYSYGSFVSPTKVSLISLCVSFGVLILVIFLPRIRKKKEESLRLDKVLGIKDARLIKFFFLVFFQQFTGLPATIIYNQILFKEFQPNFFKEISIVYSLIYFATNFFGIYYMPHYDKRFVMLFSIFCTTSTSILISTVTVLKTEVILSGNLWETFCLISTFFYVIFHTLGLGNVPFTYVENFPKNCRKSVAQIFLVTHSICALVITKIFQVLFFKYDVATPFFLFFCVGIVAFVFVLIFVKNDSKL